MLKKIEPNSDSYAYGGQGLSEPAYIMRRDQFESEYESDTCHAAISNAYGSEFVSASMI
jgi:hypothetical protein